jgi:hypothetical protein
MPLLRVVLCLALCLTTGIALHAQEEDEQPFTEPESEGIRWNLSAEVKANYRWSQAGQFPLAFPFPPEFVPAGRNRVWLETVSPGSSLEVSTVTIFLDVELPRSIFGRVKVDFIDLYDRNPTSTDRNVDVDEAYIRFGRKYESLEPPMGNSFYALFGKAPKFERQNTRRLESYGLVSTSFNRFEDLQLQVGGNAGAFYFRAQVSNGNPTFFRDPNALAGDNGTVREPNPDPTLWSGFPIFYHAEVEELQIDNEPEYGVGGGLRFISEDQEKGLDLLGFYYQTKLSEKAKLHGTFYEGDLQLLQGVGGIALPFEGDTRKEYGLNADFQLGELSLFFQWVHEDLASLPRDGIEFEVGYSILSGDPGDPNALFPLIQPAIRYSRLDNDFDAPAMFITPSLAWNWQKWDIGVRVFIIQHLDITMEYAIHSIDTSWEIKNNEFLTTLRLSL